MRSPQHLKVQVLSPSTTSKFSFARIHIAGPCFICPLSRVLSQPASLMRLSGALCPITSLPRDRATINSRGTEEGQSKTWIRFPPRHRGGWALSSTRKADVHFHILLKISADRPYEPGCFFFPILLLSDGRYGWPLLLQSRALLPPTTLQHTIQAWASSRNSRPFWFPARSHPLPAP